MKSAPLSPALRARGVDEIVVHAGHHDDPELPAAFLEELGLAPPRYRLETRFGTHGEQTGRMLPAIEAVVLEEKPDAVVVFGDANSTLAGAIAAGKLLVPVAHVEAGVRSFDRALPEELNRVLVDRMSNLLFCPSKVAVGNLGAEGVTSGVHLVGDVMYDAVRQLDPTARERSDALARNRVAPGDYLVLTLHREANLTPECLAAVGAALAELDEPVVFPARPRTHAAIAEAGIELPAKVREIPLAGYLDFAALTSQARVVLTDSGGVQKEAYWYGVPCVTLRTTTEWVETVESGWNRLAGTDSAAIVAAVREAAPRDERPAFYGDGDTAAKIADLLCTMSR